jgi:hypothetical protein
MMKPSRAMLLLCLCSTVAGCGAIMPSRLVVKNETGVTLTNVRVDCVGKVVGGKSIKPGRDAWFFCYPPNDGDLVLKYSRNGRQESQMVTYVTPPPIRADCSIILTSGEPKKPRCNFG